MGNTGPIDVDVYGGATYKSDEVTTKTSAQICTLQSEKYVKVQSSVTAISLRIELKHTYWCFLLCSAWSQ